ncbi:MAG: RNA pseudouridine synthase [Crocinitomicaceae bacterium]|nr:RNA pseudouridine synthase [Crocinitomicaceae bacterium]|tara:strand:+ start:322 stop:1422 length:1101 start_codon:yes stop_codon:yes gene_type:complete
MVEANQASGDLPSADADDQSGEELFEHHQLLADARQQPLRVDKFVLNLVSNMSRTRLQAAAKAGYVRVNGASVKSNHKVKAGDKVTIELPNPIRTFELIPEEMALDVLFEDDHLMVINKPADLVVHPGNGNYTGTLVHGVAWHLLQQQRELPPDLSSGRPRDAQFNEAIPRPGLVHRLDKDTTGVMVLGKTEKAMTSLSQQFFERSVDRRYLALVWGDLEKDGTIVGHIGRNRRNRRIQAVYVHGDEGKHAVTHYEVLERLGPVTLVQCKLETGRTHQIRVHMEHSGHPLFGDESYGGNRAVKGVRGGKYQAFLNNCFDVLPRQALHARSLAFSHPTTQERMTFETELPLDMVTVIDRWKSYLGGV